MKITARMNTQRLCSSLAQPIIAESEFKIEKEYPSHPENLSFED